MKEISKGAPSFMQRRGSGILLHVTSLPGPYGNGDLGREAFRFAEFLRQAKQSYWQILPLNPVDRGAGYSPYSSISAFGGNTLLISLDQLASDGLLSLSRLRRGRITSDTRVDFHHAEKFRAETLTQAFNNFRKQTKLQKEFGSFCRSQKKWLDDFALYVTIKRYHQAKPWFAWPTEFMTRDPEALRLFSRECATEIQEIKWQQFIFSRQWDALKQSSNGMGIRIIGDLPFYVSHDSADVWSYPEFFDLNRDGSAHSIAGVPPDYFNADGQLWGMPVFRWDVLKRNGYTWWVERIRKNFELYDVVRLDHFRAFSAYWSVPGKAKTARSGRWIKGPGPYLFEEFRKQFGNLPFIAEDLGDINDSVHELREAFQMPGMKVLQFAFGDDFPSSDYIPHLYESNFVVYTGTHDNNTTRGWFTDQAGDLEKEHLQRYLGLNVTPANVSKHLVRLALASAARVAVIPMQDILNLGSEARMNSPATVEDNWAWRMKVNSLSRELSVSLRELNETFGR